MDLPTDHPFVRRAVLSGYPVESLVDPGDVNPADLAAQSGWQLITVSEGSLERFDVDGGNVVETDRGPSDRGVEYGAFDAVQPVGFDGKLNDPLPDADAYNPKAAFFAQNVGTDAETPELSKPEAVEALTLWKPRALVPGPAARAIAAPFGAELDTNDDGDVAGDGGDYLKAAWLAKRVAVASEASAKGPDSNISGHKRRDRQTYHRNTESLQATY